MTFTASQYDEAIAALTDGKAQLVPNGQSCAICGDDGHQAFECGRNPLVAMALCQQVADQSEALHETLHGLAGFHSHLGVQLGPRRVVMPSTQEGAES